MTPWAWRSGEKGRGPEACRAEDIVLLHCSRARPACTPARPACSPPDTNHRPPLLSQLPPQLPERRGGGGGAGGRRAPRLGGRLQGGACRRRHRGGGVFLTMRSSFWWRLTPACPPACAQHSTPAEVFLPAPFRFCHTCFLLAPAPRARIVLRHALLPSTRLACIHPSSLSSHANVLSVLPRSQLGKLLHPLCCPSVPSAPQRFPSCLCVPCP